MHQSKESLEISIIDYTRIIESKPRESVKSFVAVDEDEEENFCMDY